MAVEIGALRALLSLDSAAFEKGAKRAQASMTGLQRSLTKSAAKMRSVGKTMSARVTAPLVAATGLMVRSSLSTVDAQAKFAQSLGTTTASIQTLTRAADMAGISQGDLDGSLRRMTRRISLAEQGAGAGAKAFARLGLEAADLADLDAAERIKLIQARIAELIPAAEQAAVASQVFGDKTGLAMMRLDASTIDAANAELERFGVHVEDIDADRIEEANDAMSGLGLVVTGLGNQMAVALAPVLKTISGRIAEVAEWFSDLSPRMKSMVAVGAGVAAAFGPLAIALGFVATGLAALASPIGLIVLGFGAAAGAVAYVATQWDSLVAKYPGLQTALDTVGAVASEVWRIFSNTGKAAFEVAQGYVDVFSALMRGDFHGAMQAAKGVTDTFVSYIRDTFPGVVDTVGGVIESTVQAGRDIIDAISAGIRETIQSVSTAIDELVTSLIKWITGIPGRVADAATAAGAAIINKIKEGFTGASNMGREVGADLSQGLGLGMQESMPALMGDIEAYMQDLEDTTREAVDSNSPSKDFMKIGNDLMSGLAIGIGERAQMAAQSAADAAGKVTDATAETLETGKQKLSGFFDQVGDAFAGAVVKGQSFGDAMRGIFERIASDFISSGISNLFGSIAGGMSSGGGLLGGLGQLFAGFFDAGGRIPSGKFGIAGENGAEIVSGPANVVSTADTAAMFGGGMSLKVINESGLQVEQREEVGPSGQRNPVLVFSQAVDQAITRKGSAANRSLRSRGVRDPWVRR